MTWTTDLECLLSHRSNPDAISVRCDGMAPPRIMSPHAVRAYHLDALRCTVYARRIFNFEHGAMVKR